MINKSKIAFVTLSDGERYIEYRKNLIAGISKYVSGVDTVALDKGFVVSCLSPLGVADPVKSAWLSIPLLDTLDKYERVIYIDVDSDVLTESFSEILSVDTSIDGLAACTYQDDGIKDSLKSRHPSWHGDVVFNDGVVVLDRSHVDVESWKRRIAETVSKSGRKMMRGEDILNLSFSCNLIDSNANVLWSDAQGVVDGAWLVHYSGEEGHSSLDEILSVRAGINKRIEWKDRCVVISPRHAFIKSWIRAYFATGNTIPLVIIPGPDGDWKPGDREYCEAAAEFSGGIVFDCAEEWKAARSLSVRAVRSNRIGWFSKKMLLHSVAKRLSPKTWAWIDDDAEVVDTLNECFDCAERAPGFIYTHFYYPSSIDNCHPDRTYRSLWDTADKICWNSMMFFHGNANEHLAADLGSDFPVEDDECVFCNLYQSNKDWHDGFCDFSIRKWQMICKTKEQIPSDFEGKLIHYTSDRRNFEIKRMWAEKANILRKAPFEGHDSRNVQGSCTKDDPIDAVFVIGTGSVNGNEELRYALRNLANHCRFVRDVYICGFIPPWVNRSTVKCLQWPDRFVHAKDSNIIDKLRHACEHPGIARRILFCSDDQFQTHPCTWDDFAPRYLRRYASNDGWYENRRRVWHTRLRKTLERDVQRRRASGLDANHVFYYQPHIWMPIDRDVFIDYARWSDYSQRDDTIIASGYFNFADVDGKPDFDHVFLASDSLKMPKATHVAYHDGSYSAAMSILHKLFPDRCRFEVGAGSQNPVKSKDLNIHASTMTKPNSCDRSCSKPEPANAQELSEINRVISMIRKNPIWHNLLGEVSRAEELRLYGVRGWGIVWNDIIARWKASTSNGVNDVRVDNVRSQDAAEVIRTYMDNPESVRTVRFGASAKTDVLRHESLRNRVRSSLRT